MIDDNYELKLADEYKRLVHENLLSNIFSDLGTISYLIECQDEAKIVIEKAKEILLIVDKTIIENSNFPDRKEWEKILPCWFVNKFEKEKNQQQMEEYLIWWDNLSNEEKNRQAELPRSWSLSNWISYFDPEQRQWYWWNYLIIDFTSFSISIEVRGFPFPSGALHFLLQASGAIKIEEIDE